MQTVLGDDSSDAFPINSTIYIPLSGNHQGRCFWNLK